MGSATLCLVGFGDLLRDRDGSELSAARLRLSVDDLAVILEVGEVFDFALCLVLRDIGLPSLVRSSNL